jgi:hypothetical protein
MSYNRVIQEFNKRCPAYTEELNVAIPIRRFDSCDEKNGSPPVSFTGAAIHDEPRHLLGLLSIRPDPVNSGVHCLQIFN